MKCKYCSKIGKNAGGLAKHEKHCKDNPNRVPFKRSPNAGRKKGCTAWNKGKSYEETYGIEKAEEIRVKTSNALKGKSWKDSATEDTIAKFKQDHRKAILKRYEEGWMPKAGRCEKIRYVSPYAGKITVDGTWELEVAQFLDSCKVNWKRNIRKFDYLNESSVKSKYTPDFYISDFDIFVEVKGYQTEKDLCKWRDFPRKLVVWKQKEIKNIKQGIADLESMVTLVVNTVC